MHGFFKVKANRIYWGFLVATNCVDMHEMPESAVDGMVEAMKMLSDGIDLEDVLPNEWRRMREMHAVFEKKVAQRRKEIEEENEVLTYS